MKWEDSTQGYENWGLGDACSPNMSRDYKRLMIFSHPLISVCDLIYPLPDPSLFVLLPTLATHHSFGYRY